MKFLVRDGYVVTFTERVKQMVSGAEKIVEREYNHYPGDEPAELTADQAKAHAHKLEPAPKDKDAAEFLKSLHVPEPAPVVAEAGVDTAAIAAAAAEATVAALVKAGVIKAPAAS